jgi:hypothetical protein
MMAIDPEQRFKSYEQLGLAIDMASARRARAAGWLPRGAATVADAMVAWGLLRLMLLATTRIAALREYDLGTGLSMLTLMAGLAVVGTARRGGSPGQAAFGLEIVMVETGRWPSLRVAALRTIAVYSLAWTGAIVASVTAGDLGLVSLGLGIAATLGSVAASVSRSHLHCAWWDGVAGTMVRSRRA